MTVFKMSLLTYLPSFLTMMSKIIIEDMSKTVIVIGKTIIVNNDMFENCIVNNGMLVFVLKKKLVIVKIFLKV